MTVHVMALLAAAGRGAAAQWRGETDGAMVDAGDRVPRRQKGQRPVAIGCGEGRCSAMGLCLAGWLCAIQWLVGGRLGGGQLKAALRRRGKVTAPAMTGLAFIGPQPSVAPILSAIHCLELLHCRCNRLTRLATSRLHKGCQQIASICISL